MKSKFRKKNCPTLTITVLLFVIFVFFSPNFSQAQSVSAGTKCQFSVTFTPTSSMKTLNGGTNGLYANDTFSYTVSATLNGLDTSGPYAGYCTDPLNGGNISNVRMVLYDVTNLFSTTVDNSTQPFTKGNKGPYVFNNSFTFSQKGYSGGQIISIQVGIFSSPSTHTTNYISDSQGQSNTLSLYIATVSASGSSSGTQTIGIVKTYGCPSLGATPAWTCSPNNKSDCGDVSGCTPQTCQSININQCGQSVGSSPASSPTVATPPASTPPAATTPAMAGNNGTALYNPIYGADDLTKFVVNIMQGFLAIIAVWAVAFIVIGGFRMVISQGNEETLLAAKKTITWAILGLLAAVLSFAIIAIVQNLVGVNIPATPVTVPANPTTTTVPANPTTATPPANP